MDDHPELDEFLRNVGFREPTWWQREVAKRLTEGSYQVIVSVPLTYGRSWFLAAWDAAASNRTGVNVLPSHNLQPEQVPPSAFSPTESSS